MKNAAVRPLWQIDLTALVVCAALTAAAYFFGIQPVFASQGLRAEQREQLNAGRAELTTLANTHQQLRLRRVNVQRERAENPLHLQPATHTNRRVTKLSELASACGLRVDRIQPGETRPGPRYGSKPIVLTGVGGFPKCVEFLRRLRETFPDTGVTHFDLNSDGVTGKALPTFAINLEWYTALDSAGNR